MVFMLGRDMHGNSYCGSIVANLKKPTEPISIKQFAMRDLENVNGGCCLHPHVWKRCCLSIL